LWLITSKAYQFPIGNRLEYHPNFPIIFQS
jgi:hypothetical protein